MDLLLHRYSNIEYVLNLDVGHGLSLMCKAVEKTREEQYFQMWTVQLPAMGMAGKAISFEEYKERLTGSAVDKRPTSEILAELDELEKQFEVKTDGTGNI